MISTSSSRVGPDAGVGLGCRRDEVRAQRAGQVQVLAPPPPDRPAVDRTVVGHPRLDVVLAPRTERVGHGPWIHALVEQREEGCHLCR
jgi:hypothetical protein